MRNNITIKIIASSISPAPAKPVLLNGNWQYKLPGNTNWRNMLIPNNWEKGGLQNYKGRVFFRKLFHSNILRTDVQYWLRFNGVDYKAVIWLNNKKIGNHTGYFQPFEFLVTKYLKKGINTLLVEVDSCPENIKDWPENKQYIKGVFGHHDIRPGGWNPKYIQDHSTGGIWNTVELEKSEDLRIKNILITPKLYKNYSLAKIGIHAEIEKTNGKTFIIKKNITINNPKLWWTWDQGKPNLYTLKFKIGNIEKNIQFGIRELKFDKNQNLYLNGRKIFIRGTNIIPEEYLSKYTNDRIEKDITLAKNANVNALRIHAHINKKEFYDECDKKGILIWQDFPLQWEYNNTKKFIKEAQKQSKEMVSLLYNHPSIFFWCCHNESIKSKKKLDPILYNTISKLDSSRPIIKYSDFREHPYPGWFVGNIGYFVSLPGKPLVTEFGAQALPKLSTLKRIFPKKDIWPPNWQKWSYHNFVYEQTFNIAQISMGKSINDFINNSQDYQSKLTKFAIENYRANKFSEISGLFHFMLTDPWPCISYSVTDYFRNPKKGYYTLKEVYQPVLLIYLPERPIFTIGDSIRGMFYLVNDYNYGFKNAYIKIKMGDLNYPIKKINIEPNSCIVANKFVYPLPLSDKIAPGNYDLSLEVYDSKKKMISKNAYVITLKRIPKGLLQYNAIFNW